MGWGAHVNPWLIHVNVWQKPLQHCKVISLQLIKINEKKNNFSSFRLMDLWAILTTKIQRIYKSIPIVNSTQSVFPHLTIFCYTYSTAKMDQMKFFCLFVSVFFFFFFVFLDEVRVLEIINSKISRLKISSNLTNEGFPDSGDPYSWAHF